ncbi:MAG TPA: M20 family metallopeptidase [Kineosporiaceae bacterium]|nr:M20 family metallopeptidase [Kineosporiaceae bacterium]
MSESLSQATVDELDPDSLTALSAAWHSALEGELPRAVQLRRRLHAEPELSGQEQATAALVAAAICDGTDLGQECVASTGRLVRVGPADGPAIAVRAELDALPLLERTGVNWAADNGAMHACGHDVHLAALVALARSAQMVRLPLGLLAVLQPREEAPPSGAADVVRSGRLAAHEVRAVIGAHLQPRVAAGAVTADPGPVNAAREEVRVVITGRGGHSAYPHLAVDPVSALCQAVLALQDTVRRTVDPMHPVVLSITQLSGANAFNVIPDTATATGTLRTMHRSDAEAMRRAMRETVAAIAAAHGCVGDVITRECDPALVNDPALALSARRWLAGLDVQIATPFASCGSDDFAWYGEAAPSLMMFVGTGDEDGASALHDPRFLPSAARVGAVARAMLAGYLAAAEQNLPAFECSPSTLIGRK